MALGEVEFASEERHVNLAVDGGAAVAGVERYG